ncbi:MAG: CDP-diacylglycerol--glycerol-3-phosphate 3-phosphatidyltransferase [Geodermatophilaceae bacterium]|jgi:CDP-diacylglycerol--glycerol-3-phosphate 3-phosphatidyltransferase|nr:CDP-diacylglycerol--glycerol-3-phosphate 3-phosphatidyltransferase [Geodermatophilaceae bacterium]
MSNVVPDPAASAPDPVRILNLANGLTILRLALVPVFAVLLLTGDGSDTTMRLSATLVFAGAVITDRFDGVIARQRNLITEFGKVADPIADKALIGTALVALSSLDLLPWWVTILILFREVAVTVLRFWVIRHGVIAASRGGKLKTVVQAAAIGLYILPLSGGFGTLRWWVMAVALILTVITGIDYVVRALRLRRTSARAMQRAAAARSQRTREAT